MYTLFWVFFFLSVSLITSGSVFAVASSNDELGEQQTIIKNIRETDEYPEGKVLPLIVIGVIVLFISMFFWRVKISDLTKRN